MAGKRGLKKYREHIHSKLETTTMIYLVSSADNEGHYHAEYGGARFTCPTLRELERKLDAQMELENQLSWKPIIKVKTDQFRYETETNNGISLIFERFYLAEKPNGELVSVGWDTKPANRFQNASTVWSQDAEYFQNLPTVREPRYAGDDLKIYLPYDEEVWNALEWLRGQIGLIRDMIGKALSSADGRLMLVNNAQKALPLSAPSPEAPND